MAGVSEALMKRTNERAVSLVAIYSTRRSPTSRAGFYYFGAHPAIYHLQRAIEDEGSA